MKDAVAAGGTVTLGASINLTDTLTINGGVNVTLDPAGYPISREGDTVIVVSGSNTHLTIQHSSKMSAAETITR